MRKQNSEVGLKSRKQKSNSELLKEFAELTTKKKVDRVIKLYFKHCWKDTLYVNGKYNFGAYNYIMNQVLNFCTMKDLDTLYEYLIDVKEYKSMSLYECLKTARLNIIDKPKEEYNSKQIQALKVQEYDSYLSDMLG